MSTLDAFVHRRSVAWSVAVPAEVSPVLNALASFYAGSNGGAYWNGALVLRPLVRVDGAPLDVIAWNENGLWRQRYDRLDEGVFFFGEDAFGVQYGLKDGKVLQLDPETGDLQVVGRGLEEWCLLILSDPDVQTGAPALREWEQRNRRLAVGERLLPKVPFVLGGKFSWENLVAAADADVMRIGASVADAIRNTPDGEQVILRTKHD